MTRAASLWPPSRNRLWIVFGVWAAVTLATAAALYAGAGDGRFGDFAAFHAAGRAATEGNAARIYDPGVFGAYLETFYPGQPNRLSWQYPPTYFFIAAPLSALPFIAAFFLWALGTAAGYAGAARAIVKDRLALFAMLTGPAAYAAFVSGQNGFFTAALIALAAFYPKSRPILAGVAAGLLTVKPHLGLLIPVAYVAAGCWRASIAAVVTSLALALASLALFGAEAWTTFFQALADTSSRLRPDTLPLAKMTSPMSAALFLGAPRSVAIALQIFCTLGAGAFVWRVWRREPDETLRAAALIAAAPLASPYGFHYELIALALPVVIIAMRAARDEWLSHERAMIAIAYALPAFTGMVAGMRYGVSPGFVAALIVFMLVYRRLAFQPFTPAKAGAQTN